MSDIKTKEYVQHSMLANGFCIINSQLAFDAFPGHWGSVSTAASDFTNYRRVIDRLCTGAKRYVCSVGGQDIEVFAKSRKMLAKRIEYIVGKEVIDIRTFEEAKQEETSVTPVNKKPPVKHEGNDKRRKRMAKERKEALAAEAKRQQEKHQQEQAKAVKMAADKRQSAQVKAEAKAAA